MIRFFQGIPRQVSCSTCGMAMDYAEIALIRAIVSESLTATFPSPPNPPKKFL